MAPTAYEAKEVTTRVAIADFTQAIALDPKLAPPFNNRCYDNAILGQLQTALADCNQALALRPDECQRRLTAEDSSI